MRKLPDRAIFARGEHGSRVELRRDEKPVKGVRKNKEPPCDFYADDQIVSGGLYHCLQQTEGHHGLGLSIS